LSTAERDRTCAYRIKRTAVKAKIFTNAVAANSAQAVSKLSEQNDPDSPDRHRFISSSVRSPRVQSRLYGGHKAKNGARWVVVGEHCAIEKVLAFECFGSFPSQSAVGHVGVAVDFFT
jgi:hypothetical protein